MSMGIRYAHATRSRGLTPRRGAVLLVASAVAVTGLAAAPSQAAPVRELDAVDAASLPSPALRWADPVTLDTGTPHVGEHPVQAASCPWATFCVVITQDRTILTSTDPAGAASTWVARGTLPLAPDHSRTFLGDLSCPSALLCVATEEVGEPALHTIRFFEDATSTPYVTREATASVGTFSSPQCPTADRCFALDAGRGILTSVGPTDGLASWTAVAVSDQLVSLSCPSVDLCVASTSSGLVHASSTPATAGSWKQVDAPGWESPEVSCVSESLCVATETSRAGSTTPLKVATTTSPLATEGTHAWTTTDLTGAPTDQVPQGLSCHRSGVCVLTLFDTLLVTTDPAGGASAWVTGPQNIPGAVTPRGDCPSAALCISALATGGLLVSADPTGGAHRWSETTGLRPFNAFSDVSCVKGLCVAVDVTGHVATSTAPAAATWRVSSIAGAHELTSVDCVSAKLCVAVDFHGNAYVATKPATGTWAKKRVRKDAALSAVSCPSTRLCVAVDRNGNVYSTKKPTGTWTRRTTKKFSPTSLDCPTTRLCVAADDQGRVLTSTAPLGKTWSLTRLSKITEGMSADVSCPTASLCAVALTFFADGEGEMRGDVHVATKPASGAKAWRSTRPSVRVMNVSCTASTWCHGIAYDPATQHNVIVGTATPRTGSSWTTVEDAPGAREVFQLSCTATTLCVGVGLDQVLVGS